MATKTSSVTPLMRAFAKGVTVRLGIISVQGTLYPIQKAEKDVEASFVSPDHNPVKRAWHDEITGKFYTQAELSKSVEGKVVSTEALQAIRQSTMEKNLMDVTIHPAAEVESASFPSPHSPYVFMPDPAATKVAGLIARALSDNPDYAMMGVVNLRNYEGLYRVVVWRNNLVFQRYCFASDVNPHLVAVLPDACKESLLFGQVMAKVAVPFDAESYHNEQVKRVRDAVAVLETTGALTPVKKAEAEQDVMGALTSYLEALSSN